MRTMGGLGGRGRSGHAARLLGCRLPAQRDVDEEAEEDEEAKEHAHLPHRAVGVHSHAQHGLQESAGGRQVTRGSRGEMARGMQAMEGFVSG